MELKEKWRCPQCGSANTDPCGDYYYDVISCCECSCKWENEYVYVKTTIEEDEQ